MKRNDSTESGKAKPGNKEDYIEREIIEYIPNGLANAIIVKKIAASITNMSVAADETVVGNAIAFNTFIQIIKGSAEVITSNIKYQLKLGAGMVIPANTKYTVNSIEAFKMILTIIETGSGDTYANSLN